MALKSWSRIGVPLFLLGNACGGDSGPPPISAIDVSPAFGIITTEVTLTGEDFGNAGTVTVGDVSAAISSWSNTSIVIEVPDVMPGVRTVSVTPTDGTLAAGDFKVTLRPRVYLGLDSANTEIAIMDVDTTTGALTNAAGSPIATGDANAGFGGCSEMVKINLGTRRLFATNDSTVNVFDIHPISGDLTEVTGSPFLTDAAADNYGITVNRAGTRVFVGTTNAGVAVMDVAADGSLTHVSGSPFAGPGSEDIPILSEDETYLYVNAEDVTYPAYAIASDGSLTQLENSPYPSPGDGGGFSGAWRPGHQQYLLSDGGEALLLFDTDPTTGEPSSAEGSPFATEIASASLNGHSFTADGNRLYTGTYVASVGAFNVAEDGTFTAMAGSPFDTGLASTACTAIGVDSPYLVVTNNSAASVALMGVNAAGVPAAVDGSPFTVTNTVSTSVSGVAITF